MLGGNARQIRSTATNEDVAAYLEDISEKVMNAPGVTVHLDSTLKAVDGFVGNFKTTLVSGSGEETLVEHGAAILAIGANEYQPTEYLYGEHSAVMTHLEMDSAFASGELDPKKVDNAVFIQCVGSAGSRKGPTAPRSAAPIRWSRPCTS